MKNEIVDAGDLPEKQNSKDAATNSLKQEIAMLQRRLYDELETGDAMRKTLGHRSCDSYHQLGRYAPKLVEEIAMIEREIAYLERYLLSMYSKAFNEHACFESSSNSGRLKTTGVLEVSEEIDSPDSPSVFNPRDSAARRCELSLSNRCAFLDRTTSSAEEFGGGRSDRRPTTANEISQEMVKCMSAVYCKLSESNPPLPSTASSTEVFPSPDESNPNEIECGSPHTEVRWFDLVAGERSKNIEPFLKTFGSLLSRLKELEPDKLTRAEKLAFWINVHNALIMHAFLVFGIPRNSAKRFLLLFKASYDIGGRTVTTESIRSSILRCRNSRPRQWIRPILNLKTKLKSGDDLQAYAIDHPEPLLHFALCSGNHSDPAIRVYSPNGVLQELESAKNDHIHETLVLRKDRSKILLPETARLFLKDAGLFSGGSSPAIQQILPEKLWNQYIAGKHKKEIQWVPHDFNFRYLIRTPQSGHVE